MARKPNRSEWSDKKCAIEFGKKHGYYGMAGGWIYRDNRQPIIHHTREGVTNYKRSRHNGEPICQGWSKFYSMYRRQIEAYIRQLEADAE